MPDRRVLILEDDQDLSKSYEEMITLLTSYKVIIANSLRDMQNSREEVLVCDVALLDIDLGKDEPSGIDAYKWLNDQGFRNKVYFLTGHARSHPLVAQAVLIGAATVLTKPVDIDRLLNVISGEGQSNALR